MRGIRRSGIHTQRNHCPSSHPCPGERRRGRLERRPTAFLGEPLIVGHVNLRWISLIPIFFDGGLLPLILYCLWRDCPPNLSIPSLVTERAVPIEIPNLVTSLASKGDPFIVQILSPREMPPLNCDKFLEPITGINVYQYSCICHPSSQEIRFIILQVSSQGVSYAPGNVF